MLDNITIIEPMTREEAALYIQSIKANLTDARLKLEEFDRRLGWKALGHNSMPEFFQAEFGYSLKHGYRVMLLQEVQANVAANSTAPVQLRERWVRDSGIAALAPAEQAEAITNALTMAKAEGEHVAARHVVTSVKQIRARKSIFESPYPIITHMVTCGDVTVDVARQMIQALDDLRPRARGRVIQLIGRMGLTCPDLIRPLGEMFERQGTEKESKVLPVILQTGTLGNKPLRQATLTDLRIANAEAAREHISEQLEAKRLDAIADGQPLVEPIIVTLYKGDAKRTLKVLRDSLGDEDYQALAAAMRKLNEASVAVEAAGG